MTTEAMSPANVVLMGLEASARSQYALCAADACECGQDGYLLRHTPELSPVAYAYVITEGGTVFFVGYNGRATPGVDSLWGYRFSANLNGLRGSFDNRDSCLSALEAHMVVPS